MTNASATHVSFYVPCCGSEAKISIGELPLMKGQSFIYCTDCKTFLKVSGLSIQELAELLTAQLPTKHGKEGSRGN